LAEWKGVYDWAVRYGGKRHFCTLLNVVSMERWRDRGKNGGDLVDKRDGGMCSCRIDEWMDGWWNERKNERRKERKRKERVESNPRSSLWREGRPKTKTTAT